MLHSSVRQKLAGPRGRVLPPPGPPQPALLANAAELRRLLEVIEMEILPKTAVRVAAGDKVFGAAILKEDLERSRTGPRWSPTTI